MGERCRHNRHSVVYWNRSGTPAVRAHRAASQPQQTIVALKQAGHRPANDAAGSHTAALAANDVAVEALFQQTGILRADTLEDMFALAAALSEQPLPKGTRVGILTNAGGPAILCGYL
ncbi:MAG: hypothetical protein MRJ92_01530 [Nitrospira sp.]|nr:hypothetical protein [Nitrospira sp.]